MSPNKNVFLSGCICLKRLEGTQLCLKFCLEMLGSFPKTDFNYGSSTHLPHSCLRCSVTVINVNPADGLLNILTFSLQPSNAVSGFQGSCGSGAFVKWWHFIFHLPGEMAVNAIYRKP